MRQRALGIGAVQPGPVQQAMRVEGVPDAGAVAEAETHRWFGEAEGLKVSLAGGRSTLAQMDQFSARRSTTVHLGIPSFSEAAGRTNRPTITAPGKDTHNTK